MGDLIRNALESIVLEPAETKSPVREALLQLVGIPKDPQEPPNAPEPPQALMQPETVREPSIEEELAREAPSGRPPAALGEAVYLTPERYFTREELQERIRSAVAEAAGGDARAVKRLEALRKLEATRAALERKRAEQEAYQVAPEAVAHQLALPREQDPEWRRKRAEWLEAAKAGAPDAEAKRQAFERYDALKSEGAAALIASSDPLTAKAGRNLTLAGINPAYLLRLKEADSGWILDGFEKDAKPMFGAWLRALAEAKSEADVRKELKGIEDTLRARAMRRADAIASAKRASQPMIQRLADDLSALAAVFGESSRRIGEIASGLVGDRHPALKAFVREFVHMAYDLGVPEVGISAALSEIPAMARGTGPYAGMSEDGRKREFLNNALMVALGGSAKGLGRLEGVAGQAARGAFTVLRGSMAGQAAKRELEAALEEGAEPAEAFKRAIAAGAGSWVGSGVPENVLKLRGGPQEAAREVLRPPRGEEPTLRPESAPPRAAEEAPAKPPEAELAAKPEEQLAPAQKTEQKAAPKVEATEAAKAEKLEAAAKAEAEPTQAARKQLTVPRGARALPGKYGRLTVPSAGEIGAEKVPVRYMVVELDSLRASHAVTPKGEIEASKRYPDYLREHVPGGGAEEVASLAKRAQEVAPERFLAESPDPAGGPIVITRDGIVAAGNDRATMLRLMAQTGRYDAYRHALEERAPQYGIPKSALDKLKRPVLVRIVAADAFNPDDMPLLLRIRGAEAAAEQPAGALLGALAQRAERAAGPAEPPVVERMEGAQEAGELPRKPQGALAEQGLRSELEGGEPAGIVAPGFARAMEPKAAESPASSTAVRPELAAGRALTDRVMRALYEASPTFRKVYDAVDRRLSKGRIGVERIIVGLSDMLGGLFMGRPELSAGAAERTLQESPIGRKLFQLQHGLRAKVESVAEEVLARFDEVKDLVPREKYVELADAIENGNMLAIETSFPKKVADYVAWTQERYAELASELVRAGVLKPETAGIMRGRYVMHVAAHEALRKGGLERLGVIIRRIRSLLTPMAEEAHLRKRTFRSISAALAAGKPMETDVVSLLAKGLVEETALVERMKLFEKLAKSPEFAELRDEKNGVYIDVPRPPAGYSAEEMNLLRQRKLGALANVKVKPWAAQYVSGMLSAESDWGRIAAYLAGKVGWLRKMVTLYSPKAHMAQVIDNARAMRRMGLSAAQICECWTTWAARLTGNPDMPEFKQFREEAMFRDMYAEHRRWTNLPAHDRKQLRDALVALSSSNPMKSLRSKGVALKDIPLLLWRANDIIAQSYTYTQLRKAGLTQDQANAEMLKRYPLPEAVPPFIRELDRHVLGVPFCTMAFAEGLATLRNITTPVGLVRLLGDAAAGYALQRALISLSGFTPEEWEQRRKRMAISPFAVPLGKGYYFDGGFRNSTVNIGMAAYYLTKRMAYGDTGDEAAEQYIENMAPDMLSGPVWTLAIAALIGREGLRGRRIWLERTPALVKAAQWFKLLGERMLPLPAQSILRSMRSAERVRMPMAWGGALVRAFTPVSAVPDEAILRYAERMERSGERAGETFARRNAPGALFLHRWLFGGRAR